jgi:hypothetical protein
LVNTPHEAVSTFFGSGLTALYIGSFVLKKEW